MSKYLLPWLLFTTPLIYYPGFIQVGEVVEMSTNRGLMTEIVVKCGRRSNGQILAGIMTYAKIDEMFCSSKYHCFAAPEPAFTDTCYR